MRKSIAAHAMRRSSKRSLEELDMCLVLGYDCAKVRKQALRRTVRTTSTVYYH